MEAEISYSGSSKHLMHRSSFPKQSRMSEHSTRTGNNDFKNTDSLQAKRKVLLSHIKHAHTIHTLGQPYVHTSNTTSFSLGANTEFKILFFSPRFLGIQETGTAPECSKFIYTHMWQQDVHCSLLNSPTAQIQDIQDIHTAIPRNRIMETNCIHRLYHLNNLHCDSAKQSYIFFKHSLVWHFAYLGQL